MPAGAGIQYRAGINIAVAMDDGLITPVLQDADQVDIYSLSRNWKALVDRARAKQLQPEVQQRHLYSVEFGDVWGRPV